jgi:hypothetical protein
MLRRRYLLMRRRLVRGHGWVDDKSRLTFCSCWSANDSLALSGSCPEGMVKESLRLRSTSSLALLPIPGPLFFANLAPVPIRKLKQMSSRLPWNLSLPVATIFAGNGFVLASSFSRLPSIRDRVHASPTKLAFVLVALGVGSISEMPYAARLVEQFSSRMVSRLAICISLACWGHFLSSPTQSFY